MGAWPGVIWIEIGTSACAYEYGNKPNSSAELPHPQFTVVFTKSCHCTPNSVNFRVHKILPLCPILSSLSCSQNPVTTPTSVNFRVHKILPLCPILSSLPCSQNPATEPILSQYTSLHNLTSHFFNIHCNITYTITRMSPKHCLPFGVFESQTQLLTKLNNCNRPKRKKKSTVFRRLQAYTVS